MSASSLAPGHVVTLDYIVKAPNGALIDQSDDEPLEVMVGEGQLVEGLESALLGRRAGEQLEVVVPPERGYGIHLPEKILVAHRNDLPRHFEPEVGLELTYPGEDGEALSMWVTDIQGDQVTLDGNHPLAGQELQFCVTILGVRNATRDERRQGHAALAIEEDDFETGHTTH